MRPRSESASGIQEEGRGKMKIIMRTLAANVEVEAAEATTVIMRGSGVRAPMAVGHNLPARW